MAVADIHSDTKPPIDLLIAIVVLGVAGLTLLVFFIQAVTGLATQLADPSAHHGYNGTVVAASAAPLLISGWLATPELQHTPGTRLSVASIAALFGVVFCASTTFVLAYSIERPSTFEFAAACFLLFASCGLLPVFAVTRGYLVVHRDTWTIASGDHYLDITKMSPEAQRIVGKHTNGTGKPPPAWRKLMLFGQKDGVTHGDFQRMLALETAEAKQIAESFRWRTQSETAAAAAESQALKDHSAKTALELAALRDKSRELQATFTATETRLRADIRSALEAKTNALCEVARLKDEAARTAARFTQEHHALQASAAEAQATAERLRRALLSAKTDEIRRETESRKEVTAAYAAVREEAQAAEKAKAATARLARDLAAAQTTIESLRGEVRKVTSAAAADLAAATRTQDAAHRAAARERETLTTENHALRDTIADLTHAVTAATAQIKDLQHEKATRA